MRRILFLSLAALMFLACERNSATVTDSLELDNQLTANPVVPGMAYTETVSSGLEHEIIISKDELRLGESNPGGIRLQFTTERENRYDLSNPLKVTPVFEEKDAGDLHYDVGSAISRRMPTDISYDGNSLSFTVNGKHQSYFLTEKQKALLDWTQGQLDKARELRSSLKNCGKPLCENSDSTQTVEIKSFREMTKNDVIRFFTERGYETEEIDNTRIAFSRSLSMEDELSGDLSVTGIFNMASGTFEPMGHAKVNGRVIAEWAKSEVNGKTVSKSISKREAQAGSGWNVLVNTKRKN